MSYRNNEQKSRVWFEYSKHADLSGATRVAEDVMSATGGTSGWHATLNGLQPATVYYYRAYIKNYDGEVYSSIGNFKTASGGPAQPSVVFDKARFSNSSLELELSCNGGGAEGHCSMMWSTSADMSGARELKGDYVRPSPTGTHFYASFGLTAVPDNTRIYLQGVMKTAHGIAKTGIHDFLIRNKPI